MRDAAQESVAVGFFDGVHLGHQAILRGATAAITFRNHPLAILAPARAPRLVMSLDDRIAAIRACGVRRVEAMDFSQELAHASPEDFLPRLGPRVRCGENWRFGANGIGDADFLRARGIPVDVVPYAVYAGERISSTRIRAALEAGNIADANAMLGRLFSAVGTAFRGKGVGRALGFPTLNLRLEMAIRLPFGVYAVDVDGARAIANYGVAPTMGARAWNSPCLELHFLDGTQSAAVCRTETTCIRVAFRDFIRPERKFDSVLSLANQITADIVAAGGRA